MPKRKYPVQLFRRGSRKLVRRGYHGKGTQRPYMLRMTMPPSSQGYLRRSGYYGRYAPMGTEWKWHDLTHDNPTIPTAGELSPTSINVIAQGVTESERIGRKCTIRKVQIRYNIRLPSAANQGDVLAGDIARIIVYLDMQCNGAVAGIATTADGILQTAVYNSFRNMANSGRYKILMDRSHSLNYLATGTDGTNTVSIGAVESPVFTLFKDCAIPIEYSSTTGVLSEMRSNNLGILAISAAGTIGFFGAIRLRFSDS